METSESEAKLDIYSEGSFDDTEPVLAGSISVPGTTGQSDGLGEIYNDFHLKTNIFNFC